ncbi:SDR family oxidoreductase [Amphibiibacter pelophylacis]|uniref:SDR family oxidoreductase n=1 Tax=Amphibiibacter pelophylacis TaxID=1799477 RepID=A0ACC6NZV3_9BURK
MTTRFSPADRSAARRVTLVTGACGGIGLGLCRRVLQAGDVLIALDHDAAALAALPERLAQEGVSAHDLARWHPLAADITDAPALEAALAAVTAQTGPVDVLVANAGAARGLTLQGTQRADWHADIDLNLNGTYHCVEAVRAAMMQRRSGQLVLIGSVNALAALGHPAYSAAKAALISYTRALALELGPHGIRANIVLPGTVKTPAWQARADKNPQVFEQLRKWYPLGDFATPDDIASAVLFLASDAARVITGVALPVDGGLMAGVRPLAAELTQADI